MGYDRILVFLLPQRPNERGIFMMYLLLIVGFVFLIKGADLFVEGAGSLAHSLKIPSIIIGLTVIAMGTSAPETAVSISSSLQGANEIAVGNVVGSNLFNLLVVVGVCSILHPIKITKEITKRDFPFSILATVALGIALVISGSPTVSRFDGICFLVIFAIYIFMLVRSAMASRKNSTNEEVVIHNHSVPASLLFVAIGLAGVIIGGNLVVDNATLIAKAFGMSQTLIGLTIVAIGTSLPELVTSIVASKKGENDMALGNVIGSNIFNLLLVLGVAGTVSPIHLPNMESVIDCVILLVVSLLVFFIIKRTSIVGKKTGALMVLIYVVYTIYIFYRNYFM